MSVCLVLFVDPKISDDKPVTARWFITALLAMLANGTLTVLVKAYQVKTSGQYTSLFILFGYLFASLCSFILFLVLFKKTRKADPDNQGKRFFTLPMAAIILITALASFGGNYIVAYLAPIMDGVIVYPAVQGGAPALTVVFSRILFKEKINRRKALAAMLGIVAVVMLTI